MLTPIRSSRFKKAYKLCVKRGYKIQKLDDVIALLMQNDELPPRYRAHKLVGNHVGKWECHIGPDWLLTYTIEGDILTLVDTGTHSDLF